MVIAQFLYNAVAGVGDGLSQLFNSSVGLLQAAHDNAMWKYDGDAMARHFQRVEDIEQKIDSIHSVSDAGMMMAQEPAEAFEDLLLHDNPRKMTALGTKAAVGTWIGDRFVPSTKFRAGEVNPHYDMILRRAEAQAAKGIDNGAVASNAARGAALREVLRVAEAANPLVDSLRASGKLPSNFVTTAQARAAGWAPGKALENYVPGGQIGGDIFRNSTGVLPSAKGRVWYEADVGLLGTMSRSNQPGSRLLYSNDGKLFITTNHYETVHPIGTWK